MAKCIITLAAAGRGPKIKGGVLKVGAVKRVVVVLF